MMKWRMDHFTIHSAMNVKRKTQKDDDESDDGGYGNSSVDRHYKAKMVHRRWEELYDHKGSKELKDSMKRHLYIEKYGNEALANAHLTINN